MCLCRILNVRLGFPLTLVVGICGLPLWFALAKCCGGRK